MLYLFFCSIGLLVMLGGFVFKSRIAALIGMAIVMATALLIILLMLRMLAGN